MVSVTEHDRLRVIRRVTHRFFARYVPLQDSDRILHGHRDALQSTDHSGYQIDEESDVYFHQGSVFGAEPENSLVGHLRVDGYEQSSQGDQIVLWFKSSIYCLSILEEDVPFTGDEIKVT